LTEWPVGAVMLDRGRLARLRRRRGSRKRAPPFALSKRSRMKRSRMESVLADERLRPDYQAIVAVTMLAELSEN
jgi:hypothetical protein